MPEAASLCALPGGMEQRPEGMEMLSAVRKRLTWANVAMTLALVFAMSGGAFAASKFVITSTKQIKPSVLKQLQGKAGPAGPEGKAGTAGKEGVPGKEGAAGLSGEKGAPGTNGESVTVAKASAGECKEGGTKFSNTTGSGKACNGSPWTAGGTLPSGATETGEWSMAETNASAFGTVLASISFPIPLAAPLDEHHVQANPVGFPTGASTTEKENCPGSASAPQAKSGFLCVYTVDNLNMLASPLITQSTPITGTTVIGADTVGARLEWNTSKAGQVAGDGTWAVTG
ncbi:MAG TPA: hypothetical protein VHS55_04090 [Solirubrobacteraceae bacterium]|nr:hypothetical protein [Solirubrobacteraceae bacterium]